MKRSAERAALLVACSLVVGVAAPSAEASSLCVSGKRACYKTLQAAVDAAHPGDTIHIAAGEYAGGVVIATSVKIAGAGARRTIIRGGGPVLTIGVFGAATEPVVSITGVTITGGVTTSSAQSTAFAGAPGVIARGGGIEIPPNADFSGGATVTIRNSAIRGNAVAPIATSGPTPDQVPFWPVCPSGPCRYGGAYGAGIDSSGDVTLIGTLVEGNGVGGPLASDAEGAGIWSSGALIVRSSVVRGNHATAIAPNGRYANSGGIFAVAGALTIDDSVVSGNTADLATAFPDSVDQLANSGGIHIGGDVPATISHSRISGNSISAVNTVGDANAFSGGVHADATVTLIDDVISDNSVTATVPAGSPGSAYADSGAGELAGTISDTRFAGNSVTATSATGEAIALAGATIFGGSISGSVIRGNSVTAVSGTGRAGALGGGIHTAGAVDMRDTVVSGNSGSATGASGFAQGGGIANVLLPDGPPLGLTLTDSQVTRNVVTGSAGIDVQGGGVFSAEPVVLARSVVARNVPDQCAGC